MGVAAIPAVIAAVSTVISVTGAVRAGQAAKQQSKYQAQVARNNQIIAGRAAEDARERGRIAEARQRVLTRGAVGSAKASAASRGVLAGEGSQGLLEEDILAAGEQDALTIRSSAEREALGLLQQQSDFRQEEMLAKTAGKNVRAETALNVGGQLLGGAGQVATQWNTFKGPSTSKVT